MMEFVHILYGVIVPILIIIAIGYGLHQKFHFDTKTLSKLMIYYFSPVVAFVSIYQSKVK